MSTYTCAGPLEMPHFQAQEHKIRFDLNINTVKRGELQSSYFFPQGGGGVGCCVNGTNTELNISFEEIEI